MKKIIFVILAIVFSFSLKAQFLQSDIAVSYSTINANNSYSQTFNSYGRWYGVGLNFDEIFFMDRNFNLFASFNFDGGWSKKTDNYLLDFGLAVGMGYYAYENNDKGLCILPHFALGVMDNIIQCDDFYSYYYDRKFHQTCMYMPIGVKIYYYHFFIDLYYRARLFKGNLKEWTDDYTDALIEISDVIYKRLTNVKLSQDIKTFPFFVAIGYSF